MLKENNPGQSTIESFMQGKDEKVFLINWKVVLHKNTSNKLVYLILSGENVTENFILRRQLADHKVAHRKELNQTLIDAIEKERTDIAYELHDGVNQALTVCKLMVENEKQIHQTEAMNTVVGELQSVINEIARSLTDLNH